MRGRGSPWLAALLFIVGGLVFHGEVAAREVTVGGVSQTMDPGLDPAFETRRRERPLGWAGAGLGCCLLVSALGLALWAHRSGRGRQAALGLTLASIGASLVVAEAGLHLTVDRWAAHVKIRSNCYHDNPRGYFKRSRFYDGAGAEAWCVDDLGTVWEQCEVSTADPADPRWPILALGDSFTDGVGVFGEDTWPARLESRLSESAPTRVVNCGRSDSYVAHVAKRYLAHEGRHQPRIVIYAMVLNDVPPPSHEPDRPDISFQIETREQYASRVSQHPLWGPVTSQSALARLGVEQWARWRIASETSDRYRAAYADPERAAFREAMDLVADMNQISGDRGSHLLVALWPLMHRLSSYPFAGAHQTIVQALEERGVPVVDLLPTFEGEDTTTLQVHPTDHHPNEVAHDRAAAAIASELKRRGWAGPAGRDP